MKQIYQVIDTYGGESKSWHSPLGFFESVESANKAIDQSMQDCDDMIGHGLDEQSWPIEVHIVEVPIGILKLPSELTIATKRRFEFDGKKYHEVALD